MPKNDRLLRAARRQPVDRIPVWFMRQAGRYQPEYRQIRKQYTLMEICRHPDVCAEVTHMPVRQLGVDAAILFSDIMVPVEAMGVRLEIREGTGPVIEQPIRSLNQVEALRPLVAAESLPHVLETIRLLVRDLEVPLIGFAGAPFTLASYLVEGGPSRNYVKVKQMMHGAPEVWDALISRLSAMVGDYLVEQVQAGCQAVQVFDSWVGQLSVRDYQRFVQPYMDRIAARVATTDAPLIHFGVGTGHLLASMAQIGGDVVGVDWREPIDQAWDRIGPDRAVQGNLDPVALFAPAEALEAEVRDILARTAGRPGHIFNLGHGVLPETPMDALKRVVDVVHSGDPARTWKRVIKH